ncbi:T9SS type A sorting domain-containing protein [bacterium]|nr:T9SS type A sorting domain-containing protein [bacterium]
MKLTLIAAVIFLLPAVTLSQEQASGNTDQPFREGVSRLADNSPFSHLATESFAKSAQLPFICPYFIYYQNDVSATNYFYSETGPNTSEWAMFVPVPPTTTQAKVCTVWTVKIDFELLNAPVTSKDTIRFFVRKGTSPYNTVYSTYFIAHTGRNYGYFEIDPPVVPPFNVRPIVQNPVPSLLIGYQVKVDTGHVVKYRFTTPSQYSTGNGHSFKFTSPTAIVPASTAIGVSADMVMEARICCDKWIPVELSNFNASAIDNVVNLRWRTETETNNFHFEILRAQSKEGPWESRGFVHGYGTSMEPHDYSYVDIPSAQDRAEGIAPVYWYRLRQTDFDGSTYDYAAVQVHMTDLSDARFELQSAFPNPLNLSVTDNAHFRYSMPRQAHVRISVHDMLGREIALVTDYVQDAGVHEAAWYPGNEVLRSGNYFVRFQVEGRTLTQKIAVVR